MKRITSVVMALCLALSTLTAGASVLGSEVVYTNTTKFAEGTYFTKNIFYSDQSGVGNQTEYYFEYTPNETIKPAIVNGKALYGRQNVNEIAQQMKEDGMHPLMLLNADFFSLETGVPMSDCVIDGEIITKGGVGTDAIGINEDGSAFMAWMHLYTTITVDGTAVSANLINKYRQPYSLYMLTDKFGDETYAKGTGTNVIIGNLSGDVKINNTVTGVVEQVIHTDGSIEIPDGKIVLTLDDTADEERQAEIALFQEGQEVTIHSSAQGDARWNDAKYILGATGGRIIANGQKTDVDQSAAPRSAIGITKNGNLLFYALDGRQSGHSYGARLQTLANRLLELGCVDVINLDGGGSTTISGIFPGHRDQTLINLPSDGKVRAVANFLALVNTAKPTGTLASLTLYPFTGYYLKGAQQEITALGMDDNYYAANAGKVEYSAANADVDNNKITFTNAGNITATAKTGDISTSAIYHVYDKPTRIYIYDKQTKKVPRTVKIKTEESMSFYGKAYFGNIPLTGDDSLYNWSCDENIGTITDDGTFTAAEKAATGKIYVTAGSTTDSVDVTVTDSSDLYDEAKHTTVEMTCEDGIFKAVITNNETAEVSREGISIKVDGKATDAFDFADGTITLEITDGHKIRLEITNIYDRTNIFAYTTDKEVVNDRFNDIDEHWAKDYISYMNNQGVVNGVQMETGLSFMPTNNITRGEFAVMTSNFLGLNLDEYDNTTLPYADLDTIPDWSIRQIKAMYSLGIITGRIHPDGCIRYDPTIPITRCEVAVILSRLLPETSVMKKLDLTDYADIPDWATASFDKAFGAGIIGGYADGTVKPLNNVTRAEAVKMFYTIY